IPVFTNTAPGLREFMDADAAKYPARFYRMSWPDPEQRPTISALGVDGGGLFQMHIDSVPGRPCAVLASTNFVDWEAVFTNLAGGPVDFPDPETGSFPARFYRTSLLPPAPAAFSTVAGPEGGTLLRVDSAVRPYTVSVSTDGEAWTTVSTNFAIGRIQTT